MKRWLPLLISVLAHVLMIGWLATTQITVSEKKDTKQQPLRAVLIIPPPPKVQEIQQPEIVEPQAKEPIEAEPEAISKQQPPNLEETAVEVPQEPIDNVEAIPNSTPEKTVDSPQQRVPNTAQSSTSIAEATRKALSQLQSGANQRAASDAHKYFAERDKRIITEAPKLDFEDARKLEWKRPRLKVDCADNSSKALTMLSGLFGGTVECQSYSAKDVNRFIQRRINKLPDEEEQVGQKR